MAPPVRERVGNNVTGGPVSVVTGGGTATGDTLVIYTGYNFYLASHMNAPTITGQTVVDTGISADAGEDNPHIKLYTCSLSSGGAKTVNFTVGGPGDADLTMIVYVLQGACELDGTAGTGANATTTTSHVINAASPSTADSLLLGSVVRLHGGVDENWTVPSGMTNLLEVLHGSGGQASAQQVLTASGSTGTRTFSLDGGSGGRTYAGILAAFKVSGGAATNANAENAAATVSAEVPTVRVAPPAGAVSLTLTANDATVSTSGGATNANAEVATIGLAANAHIPSVAASAEVALAALTANDMTVSSRASAEVATVTGTSDSAAPRVQTNAEAATMAAASNGVTATIAPGAEVATTAVSAPFDPTGGSIGVELIADAPVDIVFAANNATVSTATQTFANADVATLSAAANNIGAIVASIVAEASINVAAEAIQGSVGVSAITADVAALAFDTSARVSSVVEVATLVLSALDSAVQTGSFDAGDAEAAGMSIAALTPTLSIQPGSEFATIGLQGEAPGANVAASVEVALLAAVSGDVRPVVGAGADVAILAIVPNDPGARISTNAEVATLVLVVSNAGVVTGTYGWPLEVGVPYSGLSIRVGVPYTVFLFRVGTPT